ncbi:MAG: antitoxin family protein [Fimbriimonadales bacterium]|nr:antitoxin family protein [Fimbriimonadales bacterium]
MATVTVEAVYDGYALIPQQPLQLSAGQRVRVTITTAESEEWLTQLENALNYFKAHPVQRSLTDEELRRESIYED